LLLTVNPRQVSHACIICFTFLVPSAIWFVCSLCLSVGVVAPVVVVELGKCTAAPERLRWLTTANPDKVASRFPRCGGCKLEPLSKGDVTLPLAWRKLEPLSKADVTLPSAWWLQAGATFES
jgi:hypothetical protein